GPQPRGRGCWSRTPSTSALNRPLSRTGAPDRDAVPRDDEHLAAVERPHDRVTFVPELSLTELSRHIRKWAQSVVAGETPPSRRTFGREAGPDPDERGFDVRRPPLEIG